MTRLTFLAAVLVALLPVPAAAAPQILGLVATAQPIPMQCADGECSAMLSAFCLQQQRRPPDLGTAYLPAPESSVTLIAGLRDGSAQRLDAATVARFETRRGFTAMHIAVPGAALPEGTVSVAVEVAPRAAALPVAWAEDPNPLSEDEIALATGPWRIAAELVFEGESGTARAADLFARLINSLPAQGDIPLDSRESLWQRLATADMPAQVRRGFDSCIRTVDQSLGLTLRECLAERHRHLQVGNTRLYWDTLGGS